MAAVFAFLGMLLISMVVALLAAMQLGDSFGASNEFGLIILLVMAFVAGTLGLFAVTYAFTRSARPITWMAWVLAAVALTPPLLPGLIQRLADHSTNPFSVGTENTSITLELVVPALLAVLVQWGLVRRRWLRSIGDDDFTRWPWISTGLAGLIILSPYGLAFLQGTLRRGAGGDFKWEFTATVTGVVLAVLLVMAYVECYIRDRMMNRRRPPSRLPRPDDTAHESLQEAADVGNH
jgi:hypothetical protein